MFSGTPAHAFQAHTCQFGLACTTPKRFCSKALSGDEIVDSNCSGSCLQHMFHCHSFSVERGTAATHACGPWTSIWWSIIGATPRARRCAPLPCDMRYGVVQTVALHAMYTREHVLALGNITCAVLQLFAHRFRTCGCTLAGSTFWPELADRSLKPWVCTCLNPIGRKPKGSIELSGQGGQLVKGR